MHTLEQICTEFKINPDDILNAYCYGSRVYGTAREDSDWDYILVHKAAFIGPDKNAFKENAKSSEDRKIQIINFSRTGFKAELEAFNMSCLECLFLPEQFILKAKWPYSIGNFNKKEFTRNIITKASNSWHLATLAHKDERYVSSAKGFYHALRIVNFAIQIKEYGKIIDYTRATTFKKVVADNILDMNFLRSYRDLLFDKLRFEQSDLVVNI